jgi:hypothetical protein
LALPAALKKLVVLNRLDLNERISANALVIPGVLPLAKIGKRLAHDAEERRCTDATCRRLAAHARMSNPDQLSAT